MRLRAGKCSWERYLDSKHGVLDPQDTISRLPEGILTHIVSFLPSSDKDQARFLSRKWRRMNAQYQTKLWLNGQRLKELEFPEILNDDFHSLKFLSLNKCSGMRTLRLVHFKLKMIYISNCGTLKTVHFNTPNLGILCFNAPPRIRPCEVKFVNCKRLRDLQLVGVTVNTMFINCNESFPVLEILTLDECHMSECINITSHSIQYLSLLRINTPLDLDTLLNIDAPKLVSFKYNGTTVPEFQNINFPSLAKAHIYLYPNRYQMRDEIWFTRLIEMLQCLKYTERLEFCTNSEKNLIIPKQLRGTLAPPLVKKDCIVITTNSRCGSIVDLADSMLWVCPRISYLFCSSGTWASALQLSYGELSLGLPASLCSFCTSPSSRCWRHSVTGYAIDHSHEKARKEIASYLLKNLKEAGRNDIDF